VGITAGCGGDRAADVDEWVRRGLGGVDLEGRGGEGRWVLLGG
jgi:hypothetical protein